MSQVTYLKADMEKDNNRFKPKLGRIRNGGGARAKSYLNRVMNKMSGAGKSNFGIGATSQRFSGYRVGRGNEVMRHQRVGHNIGSSYRRVIIKTRIVKLVGGSTGAAGAHMRYLQREGVAEENQPGQLYNAHDDEADGKALLERSDGDRHQFQCIVSSENANELTDLKPFVRDLMKGMEDNMRLPLVLFTEQNLRERRVDVSRDYPANAPASALANRLRVARSSSP